VILERSLQAVFAGFDAAERVERVFFLLPGYKPVRDLVLDTILGPAEDVEYVSTTAPSSPPPTDS